MKAKIQRGSYLTRPPVTGDAIASIVVLDDDDQPLMTIEQIGDATIHVLRAGDEGFSVALLRLGVQPTPTNVITG